MPTNFNGFKGRAKRLDPGDYGRIGALIRVVSSWRQTQIKL